MADDNETEVHISADELKRLLAADKVATSEMNEARGALGAKLKAAQESKNLNMDGYRLMKRLSKMSAQRASHTWRTILLYGDMLGFNDQSDLEDFLKEQPDTRTPLEQAMDGEPLSPEQMAEANAAKAAKAEERENAVDAVLSGGAATRNISEKAQRALLTFRDVIGSTDDQNAINTGLDRVSLDYPEIADEAIQAATERLREIAAAQGGGEDLRPRHMQEAEQVKAPPSRRPRRKTSEDSPAVEAARANGIGRVH